VIGRVCVLVHYVARAKKTMRFTLTLNKTGQARGRISPLSSKHGKTPKQQCE
jgi:hypothetical protein